MSTIVETEEQHTFVKRPYFLVFLSLTLLTILELNVGFLAEIVGNDTDVTGLITFSLLVLALLKAYLVAAYFMGIKYQDRPWVVTGIMFGIPMFIALPVVLIPALGTVLYLCGY
ncbi:MAG: cytochrome C oxidase subunit IV family protein [Candidatus Kariarchaeaceae archaeon]